MYNPIPIRTNGVNIFPKRCVRVAIMGCFTKLWVNMHQKSVIAIKMIMSMVTSTGVLYFAKIGVNTPISSPPFNMVIPETVRN